MNYSYLALTLVLPVLILATQFYLLKRRWNKGREVQVSYLKGLLLFPKRYLKDVHDVVARKPRNASMHARLAGGFIGLMVCFYLQLIIGHISLLVLIILFGVLTLSGVMTDISRRATSEASLSTGQYAKLPYFIGGLTVSICVLVSLQFSALESLDTLRYTFLTLATVLLSYLTWSVGNGPLRHAFAGTMNLIAHPRPERFDHGRSTDLKLLDLTNEPLGVKAIHEFSSVQLTSFDACVQCGRCESACPAFAAGMPLNPKRLINDLAATLRPGKTQHYSGNAHPNIDRSLPNHDQPFVISYEEPWGISDKTIWACTSCRACVESCPMMIEHVDAIVDLRRGETLRSGALGGTAQIALENLIQTDTLAGVNVATRFDWATDMNLRHISESNGHGVLLWVGESVFDRRIQKTLKSLIKLLRAANVEPYILGKEELDCGDQARRLGDEVTFQSLAKRNIETLNQYKFDYILTADPHALHTLRNEYPALGGHYPVRHHSDVLAELLESGQLTPSKSLNEEMTYHDPCYLGRYNGEYEAPRKILEAIGANLKEMPRSRSLSHCCGGGGGSPLTDIQGEQRIPDMRMSQVKETGSHCVAVACPGCTSMLEGVPNSNVQVRDVAELLIDVVEVH